MIKLRQREVKKFDQGYIAINLDGANIKPKQWDSTVCP